MSAWPARSLFLDLDSAKDIVLAAQTAFFRISTPQRPRIYWRTPTSSTIQRSTRAVETIIGFVPVLQGSGLTVQPIGSWLRAISWRSTIVMAMPIFSAAQTWSGFDIYRVRMARSPNIGTILPLSAHHPMPSGHTPTDGPTAITDRDLTAANKALVKGFIEKFSLAWLSRP